MPRFKSAGEIAEETSQPEGNGPLGASGGVRRRRDGHKDLTDVTESEARALKTANGVNVQERLNNGWSLAWQNSPDVTQKAWGYDALAETHDQGCEVVFTPENKPFSRFDVTAVLRPPEYMQEYAEEQQEQAQSYLTAGEEEGPGFPGQFDKSRLTKEMTRQQSRANHAAGMIDAEHGLSLREGLARFSPQDRESVMERYRRGARHESADERQAKIRDEARQPERGRKSFAMGAGFDAEGRIVR